MMTMMMTTTMTMMMIIIINNNNNNNNNTHAGSGLEYSHRGSVGRKRQSRAVFPTTRGTHDSGSQMKFGKQRRCLGFARACLEPVLGMQLAGPPWHGRDLRRGVLLENKQINTAVLLTHKFPKIEAEKIMKYENLALEIKNIWKLNSIYVYPLAISAEEVTTYNFLKYLENIV